MNPRTLSLLAAAAALSSAALSETVGPNVFVDDGESLDVLSSAPIETSGNVTIAPGGDAEFRSGQKVTLKPGFIASPGSAGFFRAAIDESLLDPAQYLGPGWEPYVEYYFGSAYAQSLLNGNPDGLNHVEAFQAGTNPHSADTDGDGIEDSVDPSPLVAANAIFQ